MDELRRDIVVGFRRLSATPLFSLFAVITLAIGIAAVTATYSVIDAALDPPAGVRTIERLVDLRSARGRSLPMTALAYGDYQDYRRRQTSLDGIVGWAPFGPVVVANRQTQRVLAELVSGEYFSVLGVTAQIGRVLQPSDDRIGAPPVVVISATMWRNVFQGASDIVGRTVRINSTTFDIVGVASEEFRGLLNRGVTPSAFWVPLESARLFDDYLQRFDLVDRRRGWLLITGQLSTRATLEQARSEAASIASQLDRLFPIYMSSRLNDRDPSPRVWVVSAAKDWRLNDSTGGLASVVATGLLACIALVFFVVCTNIANLMIARAVRRARDVMVQLALGASTQRVAREVIIEAVMIASVGWLLGLGAARLILASIGRDVLVVGDVTVGLRPHMDGTVLLVSLLVTILTVVIISVTPAARAARIDVSAALQSEAGVSIAPRWRGRRTLIVLQVTISVVLLSFGAAWVAQVRAIATRDLGFDLAHLASAEIDFGLQHYDPNRARDLLDSAVQKLARVPEVDAVAVGSGLPLATYVNGALDVSRGGTSAATVLAVTGEYFETVRIPLMRGRTFKESDQANSTAVALVSSQTAKRIFGQVDVLGEHLLVTYGGQPRTCEIVGVTGDIRSRVLDESSAMVYLPWQQVESRKALIIARSETDPKYILPVLRNVLADVDPELAVTQIGTAFRVAEPTVPVLLGAATIAGALGLAGVLVALTGLSGLLSFLVLQRTREIGIRMALGAMPRELVGTVVREGVGTVLVGLLCGGVFGVLGLLAMGASATEHFDGITVLGLTSLPCVIVAIAACACWLPARRAAHVDPNTALRQL